MKKTCFLTLMAAVLLWMLPSCKPTDDPSHLTDNVVVTTAEPIMVINTAVTLGAEVTADNPGLLLELGVCWGKNEKPTIDDQSSKTYRCSMPYQCFIGNLEPNTQYHVRGFAKYGTEYCYGNEKTFTTDGGSTMTPVSTLEAYNITARSFSSGAIVLPFGATNWYAGVCYSTQPEFTIEDCEGAEIGYAEEGICYVECYELRPNTQYYYRAYLAYNDGTDNGYTFLYGNILSLTTPDVVFELDLVTYTPNLYYGNYMIAYGEMTCTKPELINQVGFCYSKTNEYPQYESDLYTICATPTGSDTNYTFESYISNLSAYSKYYVRCYARYMTDSIKYGNVVSIDTDW